MSITGLYWREASWLWLTALPVGYFFLARVGNRKRLASIADPSLLPWLVASKKDPGNRATKLLLAVAWIFFCIALAGPRTPHWIPPELRPADSSLMVILDLSASMQAGDLRPSRRSVATRQVEHWIDTTNRNMNIGLVVFAGHGHLLLPPTRDRHLLKNFLKDLDALRLPTLGNNLAEAIVHSIQALKAQPGRKSILLISDGDLGKRATTRARRIIEKRIPENAIHLTVVGIGGTEKVALPASLASQLSNENAIILTRRESATLISLAKAGQGHYRPLASARDIPLVELLEIPTPRIKPEIAGEVLWTEWFGIPLFTAILFLFFSLRPARANVNPIQPVVLLFFIFPLLLNITTAQAETAAETALKNKKYDQARSLFEKEAGYLARFGEGVACYRLKDYRCARQAFSQAAWLADNPLQRGRAAFNLGNAHFKLGEFSQAAVLFKEAEKDGVGAAARNLEFAQDLAESVKDYLAQVERRKQRADWLSNGHHIPDKLLDKLAEGITFKEKKTGARLLRSLGKEKYRQLIREGIARAVSKTPAGDNQAIWSSANKSLPPESTVGLLNRLLPMESGLNVVPDTPYRLENERPW